MSFSGNAAYSMLMVMAKVFPGMKEDFIDLDTALEKDRKFNEKNKYVSPKDKKALYK